MHKRDEIASAFAKHFSSVGEHFATKIPPSRKTSTEYLESIPSSNTSLFLSPTSPTEILNLINELPNKKSAGHDTINNVLLKSLKSVLLKPLSIVFNKSMNEGVFPEVMKLADTIPLYKNKEKYLVDNYQPISLLITLSKILEKLMHKRIYRHLEENNLIYNSQYGFRPRHSCENAVGELLSVIIKGHENNKTTIAVFLDLSKAFDTLSHTVLLEKLEKLSVLGPLLFLLFTNDLHKHLVNCGCILFADDTTIYMCHDNLNYINFCIEQDLLIISDWFKANSLTLNLTKSVAMMFKHKNSVGKLTGLQIKQVKLPLVRETKFLGIWLDNELSWNCHLSKLSAKIKRNVYLMRNHKNTLDCHTLKLIYLAQIHSHINYGLVLWGGMASSENLNKIRTTLNKCMKILKPNLETDKTYKELKLLTLDQLIELEYNKHAYKISKCLLPNKMLEIINCDQNNQSLQKQHNYNTRKKAIPNIPRSRTKYYLRTFLCNGIRAINNLSPDLLSCINIKAFVRKCKKRYESN